MVRNGVKKSTKIIGLSWRNYFLVILKWVLLISLAITILGSIFENFFGTVLVAISTFAYIKISFFEHLWAQIISYVVFVCFCALIYSIIYNLRDDAEGLGIAPVVFFGILVPLCLYI